MFLVTGLGNPNKEYDATPHNAGFLLVDSLRELLVDENIEVTDWQNEDKLFLSEICKVKKDGEVIGILQKPLTYMNLSGSAVKLIHNKFKIDNFILAHDDLDIKLSKYKIQNQKAPKNHNGVLNVQQMLKSEDFLRVRIGVENRENRNIPGEDYVLRKYTPPELDILTRTIKQACKELLPLILN